MTTTELRNAFKIRFKNLSLVSDKPSCSLVLTKATEGKTCYNWGSKPQIYDSIPVEGKVVSWSLLSHANTAPCIQTVSGNTSQTMLWVWEVKSSLSLSTLYSMGDRDRWILVGFELLALAYPVICNHSAAFPGHQTHSQLVFTCFSSLPILSAVRHTEPCELSLLFHTPSTASRIAARIAVF